jgi:pimeloyl-ACP methyl ester carboxylesterase
MGLLILLAEGLAVCLIAGVGYAVWLLTHPPRRTFATAVSRGRPGTPEQLDARPAFEEWTFISRGLELPVWDIKGGLPPGEGPTVVMTHGWGDSRIGALSRVPAVMPHCSRLILWDLPGHGEAPGRSSLGAREVQDLLALIGRVREPGVRLVLMGWSLGAGISIEAAARGAPEDVAGVIAEAPYRFPWTPARNVLRLRRLPYRWNLMPALWCVGWDVGAGPNWRGFDRAGHASHLGCPLLVIHGTLDEVSPVEDGRKIATAAPLGRLLELPEAGHYGLWTDARFAGTCAEGLRAFLSQPAPAAPSGRVT